MARRLSLAFRPARPYLITALILIAAGTGGYLAGDALDLNYLSTLLALGGMGLTLIGAILLLVAVGMIIVGWIRGRSDWTGTAQPGKRNRQGR